MLFSYPRKGGAGENGTPAADKVIAASDLEVAVLDRTRSQPRKFLRLMPARLEALLGDRAPAPPVAVAEGEINPQDVPDEPEAATPDDGSAG